MTIRCLLFWIVGLPLPGQEVSNRLDGKRCLDYGLFSGEHLISSPSFNLCTCSDHVPTCLSISGARCCSGLRTPLTSDPHHDRACFHRFAEEITGSALNSSGQPVPRRGHGRRKLPREIQAGRPQSRKMALVNLLKKKKGWPPENSELWGLWDRAIDVFKKDNVLSKKN